MSTTDAVKTWLVAERHKRDLDAELKRVKQELVSLEAQALEYLGEEGITSLRINGSTVYLSTSTYASLTEDKQAAMNFLKRAGVGDLVKESVNASSLAAWVRELRETEEGIPAALEQHIKVSEVTKLRMRSS